ncbi:PLP-dependent aminotransferase family protein [Amycolatopsis sp. EV170708-02-1]|uniref:MocR-like pyridoxine biosynthesis transcription factor PdxR n=1 Tax=Amycolatopsis sp. EV170708-02-1 TaxID=2919322 RepID=UPI001F0C470A|nr:PLP-dependent aminotransferase family protein [Amycolatopsis sp. EV170708-02-1]UMP01535.1 PLP-dependent aminotransferase family protein [Amycolatopsis sp. EV170708-02-1]
MTESQTNLAWDVLLDLSGPGPRHERLARALRTVIREGTLGSGAALPPSRTLAADLGCSRWVITQAYEQLIAEGYLAARTGSGTVVRWSASGAEPAKPAARKVSPPEIDLAPGLPDLRHFPRTRWAEALREVLVNAPHGEFGYPVPGGHPRLRAVLADHLRRCRGAVVDDVRIASGVTDAFGRLCRAMLAAGITRVAAEDPGWHILRRVATRAGLDVVSVPVDEDGLRVEEIPPGVRAVLVTPAHQFPTGTVLSPARRAGLLAWAREADGLIIEDDYDAEFRYDRRPVGTVQGMDPARVALLGSVSKTLSPALGLGWYAVPPQWTDRVESSPTPPALDQLAFAAFLERGSYDRHLRAARRRYRARRDALVAALGPLPLSGVAAGLHLVLGLPGGSAAAVVERAAAKGLRVADLDDYRVTPGEPGLVLGYGNLADGSVGTAARLLREAIAR